MSYSPGGEAPHPEGLHCLTSSWGKPPWLGWGCSRASFADWPDKPHPRNQEKDYILQFLCAPEVSPVLLVTREGGYQTSKLESWGAKYTFRGSCGSGLCLQVGPLHR